MEYIDYLTPEDLRALAVKYAEYCISIYMPTQKMSKEIRQNPIRLKNLLGKAEEELLSMGVKRAEAEAILQPGHALLGENPFWQHQSSGLALFISRDGFRSFRLPIAFNEVTVVSDRFHLKPLLTLFTGDGRFYILALSQNQVRLYHCTRHSANEIRVDGMPKDLADALRYDIPEQQLQFHTRTPGIIGASRGTSSSAKNGRRPAIFHGQGVGTDDVKDHISQYFLQIDRSLQKVLYRGRAPLVLAAVEFLHPIYRAVNSYENLLDEGIQGNPELLKADELREHAWKVAEPHFAAVQKDATEHFYQELGTGHASNDIEAVVPAAAQGRIATLFVAVGVQRWGIFNPENYRIHPHRSEEPGDEDLLDVAAVQTVLNGGTVFALKPEDIPGGEAVAAIFRY